MSKTAKLLYTPDGAHAETPTVKYVAWDMTYGYEGQLVPGQNNANFAISAFSTASDTATLTVSTNAPPVLGTINPLETSANKPISITISASDAEGDPIYTAALFLRAVPN